VNPEYYNKIRESKSSEELVSSYDSALEEIVLERAEVLSGLSNWAEYFEDSVDSLQNFTKNHAERIEESLLDYKNVITQIVSIIPDLYLDLSELTKSDRKAYNHAANTPLLKNHLANAEYEFSSQDIYRGMRAAIDCEIFREINFNTLLESAVFQVDSYASSDPAKAAMRSALDVMVFKEVKEGVGLGRSKYYIRRYGSSLIAKSAMEAALDYKVIQEVRQSRDVESARDAIESYASPNILPDLREQFLRQEFKATWLATTIEHARQDFYVQHEIPENIDLTNNMSRADIDELGEHLKETKLTLSKTPWLNIILRINLQKNIKEISQKKATLEKSYLWQRDHPAIKDAWQITIAGLESMYEHENQAPEVKNKEEIKDPDMLYEISLFKLSSKTKNNSLARKLMGYPKKEVLGVISTILTAREKSEIDGLPINDELVIDDYLLTEADSYEKSRAAEILLTLLGEDENGTLPF
jgi:hypothetical protein